MMNERAYSGRSRWRAKKLECGEFHPVQPPLRHSQLEMALDVLIEWNSDASWSSNIISFSIALRSQ